MVLLDVPGCSEKLPMVQTTMEDHFANWLTGQTKQVLFCFFLLLYSHILMLDLPVDTFWHETLWMWFKVLRTVFQLHNVQKTMLNWELGQEVLMWTVKLVVFTLSMSWKENNLTLNELIWFCLNTLNWRTFGFWFCFCFVFFAFVKH